MRWPVLLLLAPLAALDGCAKGGAAEAPDAPDVPHDAPLPKFDSPPVDQAPDLCASAATCQTAMQLGTVSGDTGNAKLSAMGYQAAWFRVRVTENDSAVLGLTLRVGAKLTSPASADYDVFVYANVGVDQVECSTTLGTTTTNGTVNEDKAEWGEGTVSNGFDDSRDVSIEIRPISGDCAPGAPWSLEVEGNWL